MVTFNSSISGTLIQINTVYSDGSSYCWTGTYFVTRGTHTVWLNDFAPCTHLSCNPPGKITSLVFIIYENQYTVPVTPTVGNPLATTPTSEYQIFLGGPC